MSTPASRPTTISRAPEAIAAAGSLLAGVALFLPWYVTDPQIAASNIDGVRGSLSGWTVHEAMRYAILGLAIVQFALCASALRDPAAGRGLIETAMVLSVNSVGIVVFFGVIFRPGEPMQSISLRYGWFLALAGTLATLAGTVYRAQKSSRRRAGGSPVSGPAATTRT